MREKGRGGDPKRWFTPHVRNPKNTDTLTAELIWLVGEGTLTVAPGGKHPRAATAANNTHRHAFGSYVTVTRDILKVNLRT